MYGLTSHLRLYGQSGARMVSLSISWSRVTISPIGRVQQRVVEIVGGVDVGGNEVVKVSAVFRKGEENIAATVSQSRGFQWYVNGVHLTALTTNLYNSR